MVFGIFYYLINGIAWYCIVLYCVVGFGARAVSRKTPIYFIYTDIHIWSCGAKPVFVAHLLYGRKARSPIDTILFNPLKELLSD